MSEYLVNSAEQATTKTGKKYLRLKLYEPGGKLWSGMFWSDAEPPPVGKVVDVLAELDSYQGQEQLKITALRVTDKDPSDVFLPKSKYDVDAMYEELLSFRDSVGNGHIRDLLNEATLDPRWRRTPAAKAMHHAFLAGLLEHTVNLCRLADMVCKLYPVLRRDLMICAAIIHDIGKMDELQCSTVIEYGIEGLLIGHISIGLVRVTKWMDELKFDAELRMIIQHLILSHHGNKSYGSPVEPAILEAQVFSNLDGLDANIGKIFGAIAKTAEGKEWTEPVEYKTKYYLGKKT